MFITVGLLLHWRPKRFMRAVAECIPATGGVLIQFPFYAVIFGMIVVGVRSPRASSAWPTSSWNVPTTAP